MSLLGKTAPDFTLLDTGRQAVTLSDLRGKQVVLAFFPAAFTGGCEAQLCTLRDGLAELNGANATVLGISVDSPFANAAFAAKNDLGFPLLSDYKREVVEAYGVALHDFAGMPGYTSAQRAAFVIDANGVVTHESISPNPGVQPDYAAIKAAL